MEVRLYKTKNKKERDQKYQYPVCPACKKDYQKLSACHECNIVVCDNCKGEHVR